MKFGKLDNIEAIDFTLPSDYSNNIELDIDKAIRPNLFIGGTGWSVKEWKGIVYPEKTKVADFLYYYSRQFNTVELNSTHYSIPKHETILKWKDTVPEDFKFCPKILQYISHSRDLGVNTDRINLFCNAVSLFENNLGSCFMQLPPYFDYSKIEILRKFLQAWPSVLPIGIELRHSSFFENKEHFTHLYKLIAGFGQSLVITDVAGRRDVLHMAYSNKKSMIRFVGNDLESSDIARIMDWTHRLKEWTDLGVKDVYFFIHQSNNIYLPKIASIFIDKIKSFDTFESRGPQLNDSSNFQLDLFNL